MFNTTLDDLARIGGVNPTVPDADAVELREPRSSNPISSNRLDRGLVDAVRCALCATGYHVLREIQIEIDRGIVLLWGRVPTYHQKQLAQATAQQVAGVRGIANGIEVVCCR